MFYFALPGERGSGRATRGLSKRGQGWLYSASSRPRIYWVCRSSTWPPSFLRVLLTEALICLDSAEFLDRGARTRGFFPTFCIQTLWKMDAYPSDPPALLGRDQGAKWTHFHTSSLSYTSRRWQAGILLVLGVKNAFVEMSGTICEWPVGLPQKVQRQGDGLIGTRCSWRRHTDVMGVRHYLIVLMFTEKLIVSVECASKLGSHCLSVTEDKWGVMSFQSVPLTQTLFLRGGESSQGESAWQLKKSIWIMCIIFTLGKAV